MIITNGRIFGEDGKFRQGRLDICGETIANIDYEEITQNTSEKTDGEIIDARGWYVIPGLVDIHLHGAAGYDFCDGTEEAFQKIVDFELSQGVTSIVPATMTYPKEVLRPLMEALAQYVKQNEQIKGITMEGPFISAGKKGAQNQCYIQKPDATLFTSLQETAGGLVKQVTVAPEVEGALDFIKEVSADCVVSIAHTEADYEETKAAFAAGANHVTHLYNAMQPFGHRDPGVIGAAYDTKEVFVELICDGEHVHPSIIRATFKMFGAERICMISDSMRATGMQPGIYSLGGQEVFLRGNRAVLADGKLAGAVTTLYDNLKRVVLQMQIPLEEAVLACTSTPARSLCLEQECGVLAVGRKADLVLLDEDLNIRCVIVSGKVIRKE